jgi:succinate dehydrogenase/fumarate reductase cytochrome b subunit
MNTGSATVAGAGTRDPRAVRKSRWPARLDWMQSASGLVLGLFMWGHMFFVSSVLLGKDAMKQLPLSTQIGFLRRKMVTMAFK